MTDRKDEILKENGVEFTHLSSQTYCSVSQAMDQYADERVLSNANAILDFVAQSTGSNNAPVTVGEIRDSIKSYAKETAIKFIEWSESNHYRQNTWPKDIKGKWNQSLISDNLFTTNELYELYLKEKEQNK